MTKREFLRMLGVGGSSAVIGRPAAAWGERIRLLGGERGPDPSEVTAGISPELRRLAERVRPGESRAHGALRVFWLGGAPSPSVRFEITTLDEARSGGALLLTERDQATVPVLLVENRGKAHVLLLAGEILVGGKQNRVVTEDILLPPQSGPLDIRVYCVEQGRWAQDSRNFESRGAFAAPALRQQVVGGRADQGQVWAEVKRYAARARASSPTASYQAIHDKPEVQAHQRKVERTIDLRAAPGAVGAAVFVAETLAGLDLFLHAGLFAREWPKLLSAYAVETYGERSGTDGDESRLRATVEDVLRTCSRVEGSLRPSPGIGRLFEFRVERLQGSALVAEGQVVHAAVL